MESIGKGSKIDLTISKGPEFVFVPNVLGKNKNDASLDLENLGLRVKIKGSGKVNNISPAIGAKVKTRRSYYPDSLDRRGLPPLR
jgi:eukaryotic-like serine/threonine-protein kinase